MSAIFHCHDPFEDASTNGKSKSWVRKDLGTVLQTEEGEAYLFPSAFLSFMSQWTKCPGEEANTVV